MNNRGMAKPKKFATQIDESTLKSLKAYARTSERSISKIVDEAVREYLQKTQVRPAFRQSMEQVIDENEDLLRRLAK